MKVPYVNFQAQFEAEKAVLMPIVERVFKQGQFIAGAEIAELEQRLAALCGTERCVALNSGTDALVMSLHALGVRSGDEVITPPNSFFASTAVIAHLGARPVFADVLPDQNMDPALIEAAITPKTKAIMPVHLTGRVADMGAIMEIAKKHGIPVVEDAAQAVGSKFNGTPSGGFGAFGCFSAHPLKNLNAAGDGGFIVTNDHEAADRIGRLCNHGLEARNNVSEWGFVSRMDTLQAAVLLHRLEQLPHVTEKRRMNASIYREHLNQDLVFCPPCKPEEFNTFHTFVVQVKERDALQSFLADRGIGTAIHYPSPLHLQKPAEKWGYKIGDFPVTERQADQILSLPVHQYLTEEHVVHVAKSVNEFCEQQS